MNPHPHPDNAITAQKLEKTYAGQANLPPKHALKGIDLDVPRGSIFGLLGPNGAGKSTFINILAGLVVKTSGRAEIWGFDIEKNPRQARASIGVVPQELTLDPFFTPAESMELHAGLYGVPKKDRRTMEILAATKLTDKAYVYARSLSGGMRRRLLVAKSMVHRPPILVLDEPTAGVDIELRQQLWDYIRELNARGVTIVLTTHYLEEAQALCDRIAIIDRGTLIICDETVNLLNLIDRKTLLIRPSEPLDKVPPLLQEYDALVVENGDLQIIYNPSQTKLADLLAKINAANITIIDLETSGNKLENVFMKLTSSHMSEDRD